MPRLFCMVLFSLLLAVASVPAADDTLPMGEFGIKSPANVRYEEYMASRPIKGRYDEWTEWEKMLLKEPEAVPALFRLYGWKTGRAPQYWIKSLYVFDGKVIFTQPDSSFTILDLDSGTVLGRLERDFHSGVIGGSNLEKLSHRIRAAHWKRCGKVLVGAEILVDIQPVFAGSQRSRGRCCAIEGGAQRKESCTRAL